MQTAETLQPFPPVSIQPGPGALCAQALAGLPRADQARREDVIGLSLQLFHDGSDECQGSGFRLSGPIAYWVQGNDQLELRSLKQVATHKLGRASFAMASLLDDQPYLDQLITHADKSLFWMTRAECHIPVVVIKDASLFLGPDQAMSQVSCVLSEGISEPADMAARRGVCAFLAALTDRS